MNWIVPFSFGWWTKRLVRKALVQYKLTKGTSCASRIASMWSIDPNTYPYYWPFWSTRTHCPYHSRNRNSNWAASPLDTMLSIPFLTWSRSLCIACILLAHPYARINFSNRSIGFVRFVRRFITSRLFSIASNSSHRWLSAVEILYMLFGTWAHCTATLHSSCFNEFIY